MRIEMRRKSGAILVWAAILAATVPGCSSTAALNSYGTISTIAGTGNFGYSGDGGPAIAAQLYDPTCVALDASGNILIGDLAVDNVRKITVSTGIITPYAGDRIAGYFGNGVPALQAEMYGPTACVTDAAGNLYLADDANNVIRRVDAVSGVITTVVGNGYLAGTPSGGSSGDDGPALLGELNHPFGVAVDASGSIYVSDLLSRRIRKVDGQTGLLSTIAGTGVYGYSGDGGQAALAQIGNPQGLVVDSGGNVYFADQASNVIRRIDAEKGTISTIAGTGKSGFSGDGGAATAAELDGPEGLAFDAAGNLYVTDEVNNVVRRIDKASGIIQTAVGGAGRGYSGDGGPATGAQMAYPYGIVIDKNNVMYVTEYVNGTVRKIVPGR